MNKKEEKTVLRLVNVSKEYYGEIPFQALKSINLEVKKGEFVSIIGPSGSGKSTLLHLLGCLDKTTGGDLYLDEVNVSTLNDNELAEIRRDKIGFIFQAFNLASTLNVFKNVELPLIIKEVDPDERIQTVENLLELVHLQKSQNMTSELSGGEKQRVAIARALANNPSMILADEPTGNLDSKNSKDVMDLISNLWENQGITVVLITHEPQVAAYSSRIIYIRDGQIEKEVKNKPVRSTEDGIKIKKLNKGDMKK